MTTVTYAQLANLPSLQKIYRLVWRLFGVNVALISPDFDQSIRYRATGKIAPFCQLLQTCADCMGQCRRCDEKHLRMAVRRRQPIRYQCYAGLTEFIIPIVLDGNVIMLLQSGQILDTKPTAKGWNTLEKAISGVSIDRRELKKRYYSIRVISPRQQEDLISLLDLFGHEIARAHQQLHLLTQKRGSQIVLLTRAFIEQHIAQPLSLEEIARAACTSKRNLTRVFLAETGMTVLDYMTDVRLSQVCQKLLYTHENCTTIAHACGFGTIQQFNRTFRRAKGMSPTEWRKKELPKLGKEML